MLLHYYYKHAYINYALCRQDLDALLTDYSKGHTTENSVWYQIKLPGTYIKPDLTKIPDLDLYQVF